jgi:hypothetical protein
MQLANVQQRQGEDDPVEVRPDLLLAFVKHLCRITVSGDAIWLAVYAAQKDIGATREEVKALLRAAWSENVTNSQWPEGF